MAWRCSCIGRMCDVINIKPLQFIDISLVICYLSFSHAVNENEKQWRIKGLTMAQWMNFNRNNRFVVVCRCETENWPYILPLHASGSYGRQAVQCHYRQAGNVTTGRQAMSGRQCNVTTVLPMHFAHFTQVKLILSLRCILSCKKLKQQIFWVATWQKETCNNIEHYSYMPGSCDS